MGPRIVVLILLGWVMSSPAESGDPPLKVCFVSGSFEYHSDQSLIPFKRHLEARYHAEVTFLSANGNWQDLPGLEALEDCDVALFFTRRLEIDGEQLERIKRYVRSDKPLVGVRTANHGFQKFLEFDKEVFGGNYHGHHGAGITQRISPVPERSDHPILSGVDTLFSKESLYQVSPIAEDCEVLMRGETHSAVSEPVVWTRVRNGGRVVYISIGGVSDFENDTFKRLLANSLFWAAGREVARKEVPLVTLERKLPKGTIPLPVRLRMESPDNKGGWMAQTETRALPLAETALLICDMWDRHWCRGASERCQALAERMDPIVELARRRGILIVHAPSETMGFYCDHPARWRAQLAPVVEPEVGPMREEPPLPIDSSDGGCDTDDQPQYQAWTRQNPAIRIDEDDMISDNGGEVYNLLAHYGIKHLFVVGVHTNMCVLGRSFGIRRMTRWGLDCILVRDLTDTMYDPKDPPQVSHEEGTDLVVRHIERYWAPSTSSGDLVTALRQR